MFYLFQVVDYFDFYYSVCYFILTFLIYLYKSITSSNSIAYELVYPRDVIGMEITLLCFLAMIQFARIYIGSSGNRSESSVSMVWFIFLTIAVVFGQLFFLLWQTYV